MLTPDEAADNTTGAFERGPRRFNHRDYLSGRRQQILQQKQTDALPSLPGDPAQGKTIPRQLMALREENMRLQQQLIDASEEMKAIHIGHRQEIENYENHIKGLIVERDTLQERYLQAEAQYQMLNDQFQRAVEEEAYRMLAEATSTTELALPGDSFTVQEDLKKTVELHLRQVEDQHVAQALYLTRQAQRKAALLEEQLALERQQTAQERESLHRMQNSLREQAEQRKRTVEAHLRAKFTATLLLITLIILAILVVVQLVLAIYLHLALGMALFVSLVACLLVAGVIAYARSLIHPIVSSAPRKAKAK